jgi:site-specific DNA recombinase
LFPQGRLEATTPPRLCRSCRRNGLGPDSRPFYRPNVRDRRTPTVLLDAQQTRLHAYITSQPGWRRVATFTDDASHATLNRGLTDALTAARAGAFDVLLVYRVDRFTHRIRDLSHLVDDLDKTGVAFRSATEPSTPVPQSGGR